MERSTTLTVVIQAASALGYLAGLGLVLRIAVQMPATFVFTMI